MSQIIVDPNELRRFRTLLRNEAQALDSQRRSLSQKFSSLGEFWKDGKRRQFEGEFQTSMRQLDRFLKESENFSAFLERKARAADNYLNR